MQSSIFMVAGEASADTHGAKVLEALKSRRPDLPVFGVGGAAMRERGFEALVRAEDMSLAGLTEVLLALPRMFRIMRTLVEQAAARRPSVAVLIDMPDFNLRLARRLKAFGIPVVYYISPQVWAWRQKRVAEIRRVVDQMLVILPFEEAFYREHGVPVRFVGHPLVEQLPAEPNTRAARQLLGIAGPGPHVALLPGSRHVEVARHLPVMLAGVRSLRQTYPTLEAVLPIASTIARPTIEAMLQAGGVPVRVVEGQSTEVLTAADVALVCSGTATLQAALLKRPMVVVYRVSWLTYQILKRLIKVAHIALVNLIAGRALVPELVQHELTAANIASQLQALLSDSSRRAELQESFTALRSQLGGENTAAQVADVVLEYVSGPTVPSITKEVVHG